MGRREPKAPQSVDRANLAQQLSKQWAALREVAAIGVHVLAEQRHLGDTLRDKRLHLRDQFVERAADLLAAHRRDNAERAGVVAADLDRHPRCVRHVATDGQGRRKRLGLLENLSNRSVLGRFAQQFGGPVHIVGAEHRVDERRLLLNEVAVLLGETAGDRDLHAGLARFGRLQVAERAVEAVVGVLADAARVEHDNVGVGLRIRRHQPVGLEQTRNAFRVVLVHLTPEGAHEIRTLCHQPRLLSQ